MYTDFSHFLLIAIPFSFFLLKYETIHWISSILYVVISAAFFGILVGYACSDFSLFITFTNSHQNTPLFYKISGTWSNHEGSLLLWCWFLGVYAFVFLSTTIIPKVVTATRKGRRVTGGGTGPCLGNRNRESLQFAEISAPGLAQAHPGIEVGGAKLTLRWSPRLQFNSTNPRPRLNLNKEIIASTVGLTHTATAKKKTATRKQNKQNRFRLFFLSYTTSIQPVVMTHFIYICIFVWFIGFLLWTSNPYLKIPFVCINSITELNPVLQDPVLAIHPPCIYAGYVASAIVFSFCVSFCIWRSVARIATPGLFKKRGSRSAAEIADPKQALFLNNPKREPLMVLGYKKNQQQKIATDIFTQIRVWMLICWCFITVGILLGSWWAYHELGWGGWWFWDPVENASLMPWLLATASIHSVKAAVRFLSSHPHQGILLWTLFLNIWTFLFSILGTFFVRSGVLTSVHSFATDSTRGLWLLFFFGWMFLMSHFFLTLMVNVNPAALSFSRLPGNTEPQPQLNKPLQFLFFNKKMQNPNSAVNTAVSYRLQFNLDSAEPKLGLNYSNPITGVQLMLIQNWLLTLICIIVFCGTATPVLFQWLFNRDVYTGALFFNTTTIPLWSCVMSVLLYQHYMHLMQKCLYSKLQVKFLVFFSAALLILHVYYFLSYNRFGLLDSVYIALSLLIFSCLIITAVQRVEFTTPFFLLQTEVYKLYGWLQQNKKSPQLCPQCGQNHLLLDNIPGKQTTGTPFFCTCAAFFFKKKENNDHSMAIAHTGVIILLLGIIMSYRYKTQSTNNMIFGNTLALPKPQPVWWDSAVFATTKSKLPFWLAFCRPPTETAVRICCLRSIDKNYGPTFQSICGNFIMYEVPFSPCPTLEKEKQSNYTYWFGGRPEELFVLSQPEKNITTEKNKAIEAIAAPWNFAVKQPSPQLSQSSFMRLFMFKSSNIKHCCASFDTSAAMSNLCQFPEKRFMTNNSNFSTINGVNSSISKVAIHTNGFLDLYTLVGGGNVDGGWYTTIMQLPFMSCIWIGFVFGIYGGVNALRICLNKYILPWQ